MSWPNLRDLTRIASWVAVAALIVQPQMVLAQQNPTVVEPSPIRVVDVALGPNGVLHGQIVGGQGQQLPITQVQLTNGHRAWNTYTDQEGRFLVEGLVGSTYQLQAGSQIQIIRAWAEGTAPPHATQSVLLVPDSYAVLGQHCGTPVCGSAICAAKHPLANPFILAGIVATAVAIPVAIHNADDDDDDDPSTP